MKFLTTLKFKTKEWNAQILVSTLLILLVVSFTVVTITVTVTKNSRQVGTNAEYDRSYNSAESKLIEVAAILSNPNLDLSNPSALESGPLAGFDCDAGLSETASPQIICGIDQPGRRRTIIGIYNSKSVDNYDLSPGEHFDIILAGNTGSPYKGRINLGWVGDAALSLTLVYELGGELKTAQQLIDPTRLADSDSGNDVLTNYTGTSGFLRGIFPVAPSASNPNSLGFSLEDSAIDTTLVPAGANYKYIRVKMFSRVLGTSLTIRPDTGNAASFPEQIRKIEAINYTLDSFQTAVPVVNSQYPLSPDTPGPISYGLDFDAFRTPVCGNNVIEGRETCDDGSDNGTGGLGCSDKCCGKLDYIILIDGSGSPYGSNADRQIKSNVDSLLNALLSSGSGNRVAIGDTTGWGNFVMSKFYNAGDAGAVTTLKSFYKPIIDWINPAFNAGLARVPYLNSKYAVGAPLSGSVADFNVQRHYACGTTTMSATAECPILPGGDYSSVSDVLKRFISTNKRDPGLNPNKTVILKIDDADWFQVPQTFLGSGIAYSTGFGVEGRPLNLALIYDGAKATKEIAKWQELTQPQFGSSIINWVTFGAIDATRISPWTQPGVVASVSGKYINSPSAADLTTTMSALTNSFCRPLSGPPQVCRLTGGSNGSNLPYYQELRVTPGPNYTIYGGFGTLAVSDRLLIKGDVSGTIIDTGCINGNDTTNGGFQVITDSYYDSFGNYWVTNERTPIDVPGTNTKIIIEVSPNCNPADGSDTVWSFDISCMQPAPNTYCQNSGPPGPGSCTPLPPG